jgi:hypothetical protein
LSIEPVKIVALVASSGLRPTCVDAAHANCYEVIGKKQLQ